MSVRHLCNSVFSTYRMWLGQNMNSHYTTLVHNSMYCYLKYHRKWLLSACAYNMRQQENIRLTGRMRLIKSTKMQ